MFGIKLRREAVKLLQEVERQYGKKVREEPNSNLDSITYACAAMDLDGTPVIKIRTGVIPTEAIIVHELFHHRYHFPTIEFVPYAGWATSSNAAYIQFILAHLYSSIQHWIFFPQMGKMGLNPDDEVRVEFEQVLQQNYFSDVNGVAPTEMRALIYFKAVMNISDREIVNRITRWYKNNDWSGALDMGMSLERIVTKADPNTIDDAIEVFVNCLKFIQRSDARFEFRGRTVKRIGAYDEPWVTIDVQRGL